MNSPSSNSSKHQVTGPSCRKLTYSFGSPTVAQDLLQRLAQRPVTSLEVFSLEGDQLGAQPVVKKAPPHM